MLMERNKIYFASDFHLGIPDYEKSLEREKRIVKWLEEVKKDAKELYLVGDIFDFWFEYKTVVPKGFVRLQGKLAELSDTGIKIHYFTGNHDMWVFDYFVKELNVEVYKKPIIRIINGKKFYIGHGDALGPGDRGYKFIKRVFSSPLSQWLFERLHPNFAIKMANYWSRKSRIATSQEKFLGEENEWLVIYSKQILLKEHFDYFIFGHRHLPLDIILNENSRYINLGEWVYNNSYAVFDGSNVELKYYKP